MARKNNGWTKVDEGLPDRDIDCLVCYYDSIFKQQFVDLAYFVYAEQKFDTVGNAALKVHPITHWMALPPLPRLTAKEK